MKTSPRLATIVILSTILVAWFSGEPDSDIRLFCTHGKVFVEFEEKGKIWGTMWLDDDGKPMSCDTDKVPPVKQSSLIREI